MRRRIKHTVMKVAVWRLSGAPRWKPQRLASEIASNLQFEGFGVSVIPMKRRKK
jgi:hypothetical protein